MTNEGRMTDDDLDKFKAALLELLSIHMSVCLDHLILQRLCEDHVPGWLASLEESRADDQSAPRQIVRDKGNPTREAIQNAESYEDILDALQGFLPKKGYRM
ncbi:MAG: hypothetical protein HYX72_05035 [Acidobacteria bacterium]|nr:hypothetical protein [Acidobacteriota bacterium]